MYQIDFSKSEHVHFIGIGGISVSGLAEILLEEGSTVTGSGSRETELTGRLMDRGARMYYGQRAANTGKESRIDVVVYTVAIHEDSLEFAAIKEKGIPMLSRAELLGEMMYNYKQAMAVSETHRKTATTSMTTDIPLADDMDPTVSMGGILQDIGGNTRVGGPELFVIEACEYTNSLLSFFPTIEVILNVKEDRLDFFEDVQDIRHSFRLSTEKLPAAGLPVVNGGIRAVDEIVGGLKRWVVTFGKGTASTYTTQNIFYDECAGSSYDLVVQREIVNRITLRVTDEHNVYNSLTAIAVAMELGVGFDAVMSGLKKFTGTDRRFKKKDEVGGITIIDNYVYHPQKIRTTLLAAKNYLYRRL